MLSEGYKIYKYEVLKYSRAFECMRRKEEAMSNLLKNMCVTD